MKNNINYFVVVQKHYSWENQTITCIIIFYTHNDILKRNVFGKD